MRTSSKLNRVVVVLVLVAGLYGAVSLLAASSSPAEPAITYKVVSYAGPSAPPTAASMQSVLDEYGKDGWDLVVIEPIVGHFIFRR